MMNTQNKEQTSIYSYIQSQSEPQWLSAYIVVPKLNIMNT